jgi:hypothetical protein
MLQSPWSVPFQKHHQISTKFQAPNHKQIPITETSMTKTAGLVSSV